MERPLKVYFGGNTLLTCLGFGVEENFLAMKAGKIGLRQDKTLPKLAAAGRIDPKLMESLAISGYTALESAMIHCAKDAAAQTATDLTAGDCALIISTTKGNIELLRTPASEIPEEAYLYTMAERVAKKLGMSRRPIVISNACISGVSALIVARRMICSGDCHHVMVIGGDLLTEFISEGFLSFKSVSPGPCRPYDATLEHGLSLGEAVGALLLTSDPKKANFPAIVLEGGTITNDANHISGPSRTGDGLHYAIEGALAEARIPRQALSFANAHGTGTAYNDEMESKALNLSELGRLPLNSLKGYIGHTLGASGVVESILTAEQLHQGICLGTAGFSKAGTSCPINVSADFRVLDMHHALKTASGFGGCNAAIVMGLESCVCKESASHTEYQAKITATYTLPQSEKPFDEHIRELYAALKAPNMKFYKMDNLSKAGYIASEYLLRGQNLKDRYAPTRIAVILENRSSSLDTDLAHQQIVNEHLKEGASPAVFVYTLPNVVSGEICIRNHFQGENTFFIDNTPGLAENYARRLIAQGTADAVIYGRCEYLAGHHDVRLTLLEKYKTMEEIIQQLKEQIIEALNLEEVTPDDIDAEAPLFEGGLGLDSIDALEIILILEKNYGIRLENTAEAKSHFYSVKTLAEYIMANRKK